MLILESLLSKNGLDEDYESYYKLKLELDLLCHSSAELAKTIQLLERKKEEIEDYRQKQLMKAGQLQYRVYTDRINLISANLELKKTVRRES